MSYNNATKGFAYGYLSRIGFDYFHRKRIIKEYHKTKKIPFKKSYLAGLLATVFFGPLGFFYTNPLLAIIFAPIELPFFVFYFGLPNPFGFLVLLLRPIQLLLMWLSLYSYNTMVLHLFGEFGGKD